MSYCIMTTVIYHSADYDGIFCREIARKFIPDANLIGWNFGDPKVPMPVEGDVYILDLSPECLDFKVGDGQRIIWIDHHKSSIEKFPKDVPGYRIDGIAACRLTWQWFTNGKPICDAIAKQSFIDRTVDEPLAVRLAGEYDVWDKRDPDAEILQYGLRASTLTSKGWDDLLDGNGGFLLSEIIDNGRICQGYQKSIDSDLVLNRSFHLKWEGLDFLCLNTGRFNSLTFDALDKPDTGHDALLGFMWNGKVWTVSMYHAQHRKDLDLSQIAVKYGGGGHRGACGFTTEILPFAFLKVN